MPRPGLLDFDALKRAVKRCSLPLCSGRIIAAGGPILEATLPGGRIGSRVAVQVPGRPVVLAEVAACLGDKVTLLPLGSMHGVGPGDPVVVVPQGDQILCGEGLKGRVIDSSGQLIDKAGDLDDVEPWPITRAAIDPLSRLPVEEQLVTGIRAIDGCLALGKGQRIGLFAGPGLGKSWLLGSLCRRAQCDTCVVCLVGERGREVAEFIDKVLGRQGMERSVVVVAPADGTTLSRARALETSTAVAEWFKNRGEHVLLLVDSLTRVVRARRDVALALGEPAGRGGYPPSSFADLPQLLERTGRDSQGSITAIYAVLTEKEEVDPVAEEMRSLLDGHIVLSAKHARAGRWPAIDVVRSVSRVFDSVVPPEHRRAGRNLLRLIGSYEEHEDLVLIGAYRRGTSRFTDLALDRLSQIEDFLRQDAQETTPLELTRARLTELARD